MECLENIIGLSKTECECLTDLIPSDLTTDDITKTNSGIYLDRLPGFNINVASGGEDCASGGIWQIMYDAREEAIADYKEALLSCVNMTYKPRANNFAGYIGQTTFSGSSNHSMAYFGQKVKPFQIKGAYMTVKRVGIIINQSTNVTLQVYSNKNTSTLIFNSSPQVPVLANQLTWANLTTPLELPLWDDNMSDLTYYFVLVGNGFTAKANKKDCGCGKKQFDPATNWMTFEGVQFNDANDPDNHSSTNSLNGIVLDVEVKCKASEIICSSQYPLDFENDAVAMGKAKAIRFRAAAIVYEKLLSTDNINRFSLMKREESIQYVGEWNNKFNEWVQYECANTTNLTNNNCLVCRETKTEILKRGVVVV